MSKTRALQFKISNAGYGGLEKYVVTNWQHIDKRRFEFDFVTYDESLSLYRTMGVTPERERRVCSPAVDKQQFLRDMTRLFQSGYDIVHLHTSWWTETTGK